MSRKNIFQLIEETYNIQFEIRKINTLFENEKYFGTGLLEYSLKELVSEYLFDNWKYRSTCITVDEYIERTNAKIFPALIDNKEEVIINFLELLENFLKLYNDNAQKLYDEESIIYYRKFGSVFYGLINTLEKRMGLTTREYKDRVVIYPKNAPLEKAIDLCEDEDVQWELIRYVREDLSLTEKRKSLAYLATNLYIEEDSSEKDEHIKSLVSKAGNILNNLHIRHNNKTGKWKNETLKDVDEEDAIALCDMVYNEMLTIVLLREHKDYDAIYSEFKKKQKDAKAKKKSEESNNGQA